MNSCTKYLLYIDQKSEFSNVQFIPPPPSPPKKQNKNKIMFIIVIAMLFSVTVNQFDVYALL